MNGTSFISRKGSRLRRGNNFIPTPPPRFYFCFLSDPKVKITGFNPMAIVPAGECIPISSEPNRLILRQGLDVRLSSLFCLARFSESRATCLDAGFDPIFCVAFVLMRSILLSWPPVPTLPSALVGLAPLWLPHLAFWLPNLSRKSRMELSSFDHIRTSTTDGRWNDSDSRRETSPQYSELEHFSSFSYSALFASAPSRTIPLFTSITSHSWFLLLYVSGSGITVRLLSDVRANEWKRHDRRIARLWCLFYIDYSSLLSTRITLTCCFWAHGRNCIVFLYSD